MKRFLVFSAKGSNETTPSGLFNTEQQAREAAERLAKESSVVDEYIVYQRLATVKREPVRASWDDPIEATKT